MKRLSLYTVFATLVFALVPTMTSASEFDGFYAGLSFGGAFRSGDGTTITSETTTLVGGPGPVNTFLAFDVKRNSFLGVLSAGYGCTWCSDYYLGLEGYISLSDYNRTSPSEEIGASGTGGANRLNYSNSIKTKLNTFEFGLDLRPGYILCPDTMLYGRVGIAFNRLSISANPALSSTIAGIGTGSLSLGRSSTRGALRLGLGLERRLWDCFSIRADYIYTYYGRISVSDTATTTVVGVSTTTIANTTKLNHLHGNAVMLGLFYYW